MMERIRWLLAALKNHLWTKWRFVGFCYPPEKPIFSLPATGAERIWKASSADRQRIQRELFPAMEGTEAAGDKHYFKNLGHESSPCFLAERDGQLVHYTWVFLNALRSPAMKVPLIRRNAQVGDVYVGPVFTHPKARGTWVYPAVLRAVLEFMRTVQPRARVLLVVSGDNKPGISFFTRLGFERLS